jgi:hypothetical protein
MAPEVLSGAHARRGRRRGGRFWSALAAPEQAALLAAGATRRFQRGRALMHDGQSPDIVMVRSSHVNNVTVTPTGREVVLAIRGAQPDAAMALLGMLARRLRDADAKRTGFAALTTMVRVAERPLQLADGVGVEDDGRILIQLRLSQEELAGWTGASRALVTMRSLGWIETRRREIRVRDVERGAAPSPERVK